MADKYPGSHSSKVDYSDVWNEIFEIYDFCITDIVEKYNQKFNCNFDRRFYEIILGPWLLNFISIIFSLKILKYEYFDRRKKNEKIIIPCNYNDFSELLKREEYINFLIDIIYNFKKINDLIDVEIFNSKQKYSIIKRCILGIFDTISCSIYSDKRIKFVQPYFSYNHNFKMFYLIFKSKFRITEVMDYLPKIKLDRNINREIRNDIQLNNSKISEMGKLIYKLFPLCIPVDYLENFPIIISQLKNSEFVKIYFTANMRAFSTPMQYLVAMGVSSNHSKIIIQQHGGGYGILKNTTAQFLDDRQSDMFLTWGWINKNPKFIPFVSTKLYNYRKKYNKKTNRVALVIGTGHRNFNLVHTYSSQFRFSALEDNMKIMRDIGHFSQFVIRTAADEDYGWNEIDQLREYSKKLKLNISFENNCSYSKFLESVDLVIMDYIGTTFLESIARNIPTIVYLDHHIVEFSDDSLQFIEELRSVGIIQNNVESTILFVKDMIKNKSIELWWNSFELQIIRERFLSLYANHKSGWKDDLIIMLENFIHSE